MLFFLYSRQGKTKENQVDLKSKKFCFYALIIIALELILLSLFHSSRIAVLAQSIGVSIFAAYIFYFVTIYAPAEKKKKQANNILRSPMTNLHSHMKKILAIFNGLLAVTEDNTIAYKDDSIVSIQKEIYFKIDNLLYSENILFFIAHNVRLLKKNIDKIAGNRCFYNLDEEVIDNILRLQASEFLVHLEHMHLQKTPGIKMHYGDLYNELEEIKQIYAYLTQTKVLPTVEPMTEQEKEHYNMTVPELIMKSQSHDMSKISVLILNNVCYIPK